MFKTDKYNQTEFSAEEPLYEKISSPQKPAEPVIQKIEEEIAPVNNKKKKIIIASIVIFVSFLIILSILMSGGGGTVSNGDAEPTPTPEAADTRTPMQVRLEELKTELRDADPNQQPLLFPAMDYDISLGSTDD
ncbi:MAG: hypothetical protein COU65_03950 [Candidatus Pacebacteria bacterium CG10_big_fil_rev_8_21_14_0_10_42_12]|nr:hypothetical protein [Candidatus Paceibacterota bacterium]PIR62325.1 MAG: hypothetical protein COU65_03950 [Candidatus Pacebacteria bacterium CG10_big_fil_rev_8_21_14_0_10_42_12]